MLENYSKDTLGIIKQNDRLPFIYDTTYINKGYAAAPVEAMSHLRFGHLVGSIGKIPESLLDVGYGSGDFLKCASKIVKDINGYDIPPAFPLEGIQIVSGLYDRHYDVVTFFDALEHFENPYEIEQLNANYIHISLPWCHYFSDDWFENWKHRKPNEHLWHFNPESLERFMNKIGYRMLSCSNIEDVIRKSPGDWENILTATFKRNK